MDPSCSGSGLPEHHLSADADSDAGRLKRLAAFQRRILPRGAKRQAKRQGGRDDPGDFMDDFLGLMILMILMLKLILVKFGGS